MSRRPARFTEADLNRARKIADLSMPPRIVEVTPEGAIRLIPQGKRPVDDSEREGDDDRRIAL